MKSELVVRSIANYLLTERAYKSKLHVKRIRTLDKFAMTVCGF